MKPDNHAFLIETFKVAVCLLAGFIVGCGSQDTGGPPPLPEVAYVSVSAQPVPLTTELPGRTSAYLSAEVRPQVTGIIKERLFAEGADVRTGQPLYQIDPALYQATAENAEAAVARAEAQLSAITLRETRFRKLLTDQAVSRQEYDDTAAALKQVQAEIQLARANLETARINLRHTTLTAPISGRIGRSSVTQGALVTAGQPTALATIQQMNPMYVDVTQSTADILRLRRELQGGKLDADPKSKHTVRLLLDDGTPYPQTGELQFRDVSVDPTTGSVILRVVFQNPQGILLPGMFVRAVVQDGVNPRAILVSHQAISRDPKGNPHVWIVDDTGKAQQRPVTIDRAVGNSWLVSSGLAAGDRVIVEGMLRLRPGSPVKAVPFQPKGPQPPSDPKID